MIKRTLETKIKEQINKFPVISVTGPRQSGKTTLIRNLFPNYSYFNLENLNTKKIVTQDPVGFINSLEGPTIIDEIQKYPDLLSQIQIEVDETGKMGQFVVTGSESMLLSDKIAQSLAGRVANNILLPLSYKELRQEGLLKDKIETQILEGFYPRLYSNSINHNEFYPEYINTYVQKDIRQIKNIVKLSLFEKFMFLLAGRCGQLLNLESLSNDVGVSATTLEEWLSILEASYIVYRLKPYHSNLGKRVIKSPKVYFYDVGLLCSLLGIDTEEELRAHFAFGNIFENLVINEFQKYILNNKTSHKLYFFRDSNGNEVDLVVEKAGQQNGIEIKSSETFSQNFIKGLDRFYSTGKVSGNGYVLYRGDVLQDVGSYSLVNLDGIPEIFKKI